MSTQDINRIYEGWKERMLLLTSVWHVLLLNNSPMVNPWYKFLAQSRIKLFTTTLNLLVPQVAAFTCICNQVINIIKEASITLNETEHLSLKINK